MSRKDIIIVSVLVNAGLLTILLISALTTKENYFVASSAQVAGTILESNENGMLLAPKIEEPIVAVDNALEKKEIETPFVKLEEEKIIHKLPEIAPIVEKVEKQIEKPKSNKFIEVIVKRGDSLEKIARANKTTISNIVKINDLPNTFLRIGQTLLVPKSDNNTVVAKEIKSSSDYYTVKCGDNPWTIAMKHHLKVEELLKLNNLNNETAKKLRPGNKLKIR